MILSFRHFLLISQYSLCLIFLVEKKYVPVRGNLLLVLLYLHIVTSVSLPAVEEKLPYQTVWLRPSTVVWTQGGTILCQSMEV